MKPSLSLTILKVVVFSVLIICSANIGSFAQTGATCNDAIPDNMVSAPVTPSPHATNLTDMWCSFVATGTDAQITMGGAKYSDVANSHIHSITLYEGVCSNLTVKAQDELPFIDDAEELSVDASDLVVGNTYYVRARREADAATCPNCASSGSPSANFNLGVQKVDVMETLDFHLGNSSFDETPSTNHTYWTNKGQIMDTDGNPRRDIKLYTRGSIPNAYVMDDKVAFVFTEIGNPTATHHRVDMTLVGADPTRVFKAEKTGGRLNHYKPHVPNGIRKMEGFRDVVSNRVYPNIDMRLSSNPKGMKFRFTTQPGGDPDDIVLQFDGADLVVVTADGGLKLVTSSGDIEFEAGHAFSINPSGNVVPMPWQAKFIQVSANTVKFDVRQYPSFMPLVIQVDRGHQASAGTAANGNLEHSTYLGGDGAVGTGDDVGMDVRHDDFGNVYVTGYTAGSNFPGVTGASFQSTFNGYYDIFITKFLPTGALKWSTYYGGSTDMDTVGDDRAASLLVSRDGSIYVAGGTFSNDFPIVNNSPDNPYLQTKLQRGGASSGVIVRLDTDGQSIWSTYFGGNTDVNISKITEDTQDNLIICGRVAGQTSQFFPVESYIPSAIQCGVPNDRGFPLCDPSGVAYYNPDISGGFAMDAFIAKFNAQRELVYSTTFGGTDDDEILDLIVDESDNSYYVTGHTSSNIAGDNNTVSPCDVPTNGGFPLCDLGGGAYYQDQYPGSASNRKAFIAKFSSNNELLWNTYFGSNQRVYGNHLALTSDGDLYLVGRVNTAASTPLPDQFCDVPTNGGFPLCDLGGNAYFRDNDGLNVAVDNYIAKFSPSKQLVWSTFLGGSTDEITFNLPWTRDHGQINIDADGGGNIFIVGTTESDDIVTENPGGFYYEPTNIGTGGTRDAYLASFNSSGEVVWATHFGGAGSSFGTGTDVGHGITVDQLNQKVYITGATNSSTFEQVCPSDPNAYCASGINEPGTGKFDAYLARFSVGYIVGLDDSQSGLSQELQLYPNPGSSEVVVAFKLKQRTDVFVKTYNALGQLTTSVSLPNQIGSVAHTINIGDLPIGVYFVQVDLGSMTINKKLVKL